MCSSSFSGLAIKISCGHFVDTLLWSNADPAFFKVSVLTFATHGRHKPRRHILSPWWKFAVWWLRRSKRHHGLASCKQDSVNINQCLIMMNLSSIIFCIALSNFLEAFCRYYLLWQRHKYFPYHYLCRYLDYNADTHMFGRVNPVDLEQHFCQLTRVYP